MSAALVMALCTLLAVAAQPASVAYAAPRPAAHATHHTPSKARKPAGSSTSSPKGHQDGQGDGQGNGSGSGSGGTRPQAAHGNGGNAQASQGQQSNTQNGVKASVSSPTGNPGNGRGRGRPQKSVKAPKPATVTPAHPSKSPRKPVRMPTATPPVPLLHLVPPTGPGQPVLLASTPVPPTGGGAGAATLTVAATVVRPTRTAASTAPATGTHRLGKRPLAAVGAPALSLNTADHLSIPIFFGFGMALFILLQALVDRRDPKVTRAPQHGDDDSIGFK